MKFYLVMENVIPVIEFWFLKKKNGKMKYFTQFYHCKNIFFFEGPHKYDVYDVCEYKIPKPKRRNAGFCIWSSQKFLEHDVVRIV